MRKNNKIINIYLIMICIITITAGWANADGSSLTAEYLRCENRIDPLGIDINTPRLSWVLNSSLRGQFQSAYRVLVASELDILAQDTGDLWDSGKVENSDLNSIAYAGNTLTSGTSCYWKVMVWDGSDHSSNWSDPARWSMGILDQQQWQGQWIGYDPQETVETTPDAINNAKWIWNTSSASSSAVPGAVCFRRSFDISDASLVGDAYCYITADDEFVLYINGVEYFSNSSHTILNKIDVSNAFISGTNVVAVKATNNGTSNNPAGMICAVDIYGKTSGHLTILSDSNWVCSTSQDTSWYENDYDDASWLSSYVLGNFSMSLWNSPKMQFLPPPRYLRHQWQLSDKQVKRAYISATSLGIYQLYINGSRISDDYFSPGWTDYSKRVYYRTYDVTDALQAGNNAIGAVLADGWYAGYVGYAREREHYGNKIRFLCQLNIEYEDGTTEVVASGSDWKASLGPLRYADFLQGEFYDARMELNGWDTPGYDDSLWESVVTGTNEVYPQVQAAISQPVRVFAEVDPVSVTEPESGCYIFDLGQNFAGFVRLKVSGQPGQKVKLRHAEWLNPDGTIYTENLRSASATDTYICKGDGIEIWQPYNTFHGFQYVEVTGLGEMPSLDTVTGLALSSDTPLSGTFECSDPMVNQIQSNALWTQRMNFIDIPTDCPQRDERLGWTGDAQVYINTACYHTDVQAFFTKWIIDLNDGQRSDGQFPTVTPVKVSGDDGGPAWADAGVICPWTIYKMYGDKQILADSYQAMKQFISFCKNRCRDGLLPPSSYHCFGDWLNINDNTPNDVIFMAYFGYSTSLVAQTAQVLGYTDDANYYNQLFDDIKTSFKDEYIDSEGKIYGDTQSAYVMAIAYDMLSENDADLAAEHLVRRIKEENWHLSTGFVGTKDLMLALAKIDRNDIAYKLLHNDTFPSWGYSIRQGATTIWERWDGWTPEGGFNNPGMNSFAHYSFGAVCQWIFENIGGIQTDGAGFKNIIIKPQPDNKLKWANTSYMTVHGKVETSWQINNAKFKCDLSIPTGTAATVYIVSDNPESVVESGVLASQAEGVTYVGYDGKFAVYNIVSGVYSFESDVAWKVKTWSTDQDSNISAGKIYTHKINFNADPSNSTVINGVEFDNVNIRSGQNWSLNGASNTHNADQTAVDGDSGVLLEGFFYGEPAVLRIWGLSPGEDYVLTHYARGFGDMFGRLVGIYDSENGTSSTIDQNYYGDQQGGIFQYHYKASQSGEVMLEYIADNPADTWHHYAFSNELYNDVYLDPSPLPGDVLDDGQLINWTMHGSVDNVTYNVLISESNSMDSIVYEEYGFESSELDILLGYERTYYWQVQVLDDGELIYTSPVWHFDRGTMPELAEKALLWSFDEEDSDIAFETAGVTGADGTLYNFSDTSFGDSRIYGLSNNALYFDSDDEYVDLNSAGAAVSTLAAGDFAFSGYIRTFDDYGPVISMRNLTDETPIIDVAIGAEGIHNEPGKLCLIARNDNNNHTAISSGVLVNDGLWHCIVVNKSNGVWSLYIDGANCGEFSLSGTFDLNCLAIGSERKWVIDNWQPDVWYYRYYNGVVDEFTIWSGALPYVQINGMVDKLPDISDVNYDLITDIADLEIVAKNWIEGSSADCIPAVNVMSGDINYDCIIDLADFSSIADKWLME